MKERFIGREFFVSAAALNGDSLKTRSPNLSFASLHDFDSKWRKDLTRLERGIN